MATLNIYVTGGDNVWYRNIYEMIDGSNIFLIILFNELEAPIFLAMYFEKTVFGIGLPFVLLIIYLMPLLSKIWRDRIKFVSMFFLVPGSFLLVHNVMRQGISEVFFLLLLLSLNGSFLKLKFLPVLSHRFGLIMIFLIKIIKDRKIKAIGFSVLFGLITGLVIKLATSPESIVAYEKLEFSMLNFLFKLFVCLLPLMIKIFISRFKMSYFECGYLIFFGIVLLFTMSIHGRLADRTVFFLIPLTLYSFFLYTNERNDRTQWIGFLGISFFVLSIVAMARDSFLDMFI